MPLYKEDRKDTVLNKTSEELETAQILNSTAVSKVITNQISGYKWKVNYFNQVLDKMDPPKQLDTATNSTLQPYRLIEDTTLILTNPITSASTSNVNGEAYIDIGMAVHKYDLFIAEVHNKVAIFYVEEVRNETYENNAITYIIFKFFAFTSDEITYNNLKNKVVTEYVYNANYRFSNEKQILLKNDVFTYSKGIKFMQTIMAHYYQNHFDTRLRLFLDINKKGERLLDTYLNKFIKSTLPSNIFEWVDKVEYQDMEEYRNLNIFDCLTKSLTLDLVDKLHIVNPAIKYSSNLHKDIIKVRAMSDYGNDYVDFYTKHFFIEDDFYTKDLERFESHENFEIILFKFINEKSIILEEIKTAINMYKNDEFRYYKIPILVFIYFKTLEEFKF